MLEAIGTQQAEPTYIPTSISDIHTCRHTYRADMHTYRHENTQTEVPTKLTEGVVRASKFINAHN